MSHQSYLCVMIDARNEADPCALKLRGNNQQLQHTAQRISYNATAGRLPLAVYTQLKIPIITRVRAVKNGVSDPSVHSSTRTSRLASVAIWHIFFLFV